MGLMLEVVGPKAQALGGAARTDFTAGGNIGRKPGNKLVLPDVFVSGCHARITCVDGVYLLEDTSTNGMAVNSPGARLAQGQQHTLRDGDRLFIEDYEIRVSLSAAAPKPRPVPLAPAPMPQPPSMPTDPVRSMGLEPDDPFTETQTDPLQALGLAAPPKPRASGPRAADLAAGSVIHQHYAPPEPIVPPPPRPSTPVNLIPDDYDPLAQEDPAPARVVPRQPTVVTPAVPAPGPSPQFEKRVVSPPSVAPPVVTPPPSSPAAPPAPRRPAQAPAARPSVGGQGPRGSSSTQQAPSASNAPSSGQPPARPAANSRVAADSTTGERARPVAAPPTEGRAKDLDFAAVLAAAGITDVPPTPELARNFGLILRVVISGLMEVLHTRERIKDEFRMRMTTFRQVDNNPLKFSANVEDALHNLLVKRNPAYLGTVEAFEDAFADLRNHQIAMLEGIRVAYQSMLDEFEPGRLQEQFEAQLKRGSILGLAAKSKYWELYSDRFHAMVKDADSSFRSLFGDEFAKAYEAQLERLKSMDRANRR
jgi:predicted component of type VI protein secretion system